MAKVTIAFGVLMIILGIAGFLPHRAGTALIPAYLGAALVILGIIAQAPHRRQHAMHVAVIIGLLGFLGSTGKFLSSAVKGNWPSAVGVISQVGTSLICLIFVILCVRSFIAARRSRQAGL